MEIGRIEEKRKDPMIHLETERLILRDYTENDFDAYYKLKTDDKTMYYLQRNEKSPFYWEFSITIFYIFYLFYSNSEK